MFALAITVGHDKLLLNLAFKFNSCLYIKAWRESLMAEIGTAKLEYERVEKELEAAAREVEQTRGDAAMAARVAATKIFGLEKRLGRAVQVYIIKTCVVSAYGCSA